MRYVQEQRKKLPLKNPIFFFLILKHSYPPEEKKKTENGIYYLNKALLRKNIVVEEL